MIHVDLPATMECVEKDCETKLAIKLALTVGGTFVARPPHGHGWQLAMSENGVFLCRCPQHHAQIERVPLAVVGAKH